MQAMYVCMYVCTYILYAGNLVRAVVNIDNCHFCGAGAVPVMLWRKSGISTSWYHQTDLYRLHATEVVLSDLQNMITALQPTILWRPAVHGHTSTVTHTRHM